MGPCASFLHYWPFFTLRTFSCRTSKEKKVQVIIFGQEIQPSYVLKWLSSMAVIKVYLYHALQFNGVGSKLANAV